MSLSNNADIAQPTKGIERSQTETMVHSDENELPANVATVSREELRKYAQCKRVGNYLLGRTVGEGSFAKVKEAIHILTGEKVRQPYIVCNIGVHLSGICGISPYSRSHSGLSSYIWAYI